MYKLIVFVALIIFQTASLTWGASYLLQLKNGNELRTSHYWEEGDEIKFYTYGGVAGVQKAFVSKVTISNLNYKEDIASKEDIDKNRAPSVSVSPKSKESRQMQTGTRESQPDEKIGKDEVVDFDYYRERKATLKEKLEDAIKRHREATARKDQEAKESTRKEYLEFSKQIIDLGDDLKRKNKGMLPDWWQE
jgi:hypothetical protein